MSPKSQIFKCEAHNFFNQPSYIVCEPTGGCKLHDSAPVKLSDIFLFFFLFHCDKNDLDS